MKPVGPRSPKSATLLGAAASIAVVMPMFLVGASAVELTADLGIDRSGLGLAVGVFHATGVVTALRAGRVVDRFGSILAVRFGAGTAALACFGIAVLADGLGSLLAFMFVAGCANVLAQPASNRLIALTVPARRQGVAFGIKQSAPPAGSMLAGLGVPLVVLTYGWETAYVIAGVAALGVILLAGRRMPPAARPPRPRAVRLTPQDHALVLRLSVAIGLAAGASATVFTFYVDAAVQAGGSQGGAGIVLAVASLASILTRLTCGVLADRMHGDRLNLVIGLLTMGIVGIALLMTGRPALMAIGAVVALAGTWGVNGLFWYVILQAFSYAPGTVSGVIARGLLFAATASPLLFGVLATRIGMGAAWLFALVVAVLAVTTMSTGAKRLAAAGPSPAAGQG